MNLPEFCIRRPVFSTVMMIIIVLIGMVSYSYLMVRQYPQVEKPVVSVRTTYEGASPEIIETQVTKVLESTLAGVEGLDTMTSVSEQESSRIDLHFKPDRTLDSAASDVRDRIGRVASRLPKEADAPIVKKTDSDAEAIIYLALTSEVMSPAEMYDFADRDTKDKIEALTGVASVELYGASAYVMHVWLNPEKLAAYHLTVSDVTEALVQQNVEIPAGRLISKDREFQVTTSANLKTEEDFNNLVLTEAKGYLVRLQDVGHAEFSPYDDRSYVSLNGKQAVAIEIVKKSTANPLDLAKDLFKKLPEIQKSLPKDLKIEVAYDKTLYIQSSIDAVYRTIWEATAFVIAVVFLFLWSGRGALIPLITIPVSLIGTFTLMYMFGFSINVLTLLALVLAIGLVVDDAIVMLENIYRHIEEGESPFEAALKGSKEITFAIVAMTLTLAAVYAPIALSQGMIGKIFTEFALTLAGSVIISGFVALTLSPMMCARFLRRPGENSVGVRVVKKKPSQSSILNWFLGEVSPNVRVLNWIDEVYAKTLKGVLKFKVWTVSLAILVGILGGLIGLYGLKNELVPVDDKGIVYGKGEGPQSSTLKYVLPYVKEMDKIFNNLPEVEKQLTVVTIPTIVTYNLLKPWEERKRTVPEIMTAIKPSLMNITGIYAWPSAGASFFGGGGANSEALNFVIQTTRSYDDLIEVAKLIQSLIQRNPGIGRVQADIGNDAIEYFIDVDRNKAAALGITEDVIAKTLDSLVSGRVVTKLKKEGQQYDVRAQLVEHSRKNPYDLNGVYLKSKVGQDSQMVPLSTFVDVKTRSVPVEINHFNQLKSITISAELNTGFSLGEAIVFLETIKERVLPEGFQTDFSGETRRFIESKNTLYLIFGLALAFIFLVMAAQFESFIDPLVIMFSVPLSLAGALFALWITGGTLNIFSQIGLVTLIGLITKHGILIVDFANKLRGKGRSISEAILEASRLRLRPILMTTAAMVLGAVPLTFASGAGALGRQQIGWVIVGGMAFGTLLTLFVVPVIYTLFTPKIYKSVDTSS